MAPCLTGVALELCASKVPFRLGAAGGRARNHDSIGIVRDIEGALEARQARCSTGAGRV